LRQHSGETGPHLRAPAPKGHEASACTERFQTLRQKDRGGSGFPCRASGEPTSARVHESARDRCLSILSGTSAMSTPSLRELEHSHAFVERHIGPSDVEIAKMLSVVGHDSLDAFTAAIVPSSIAGTGTLNLPDALTEPQALEK